MTLRAADKVHSVLLLIELVTTCGAILKYNICPVPISFHSYSYKKISINKICNVKYKLSMIGLDLKADEVS